MITVADIFLAHARQFAGKPALISDEHTITFDGLALQATKVANALAARGLGPGHRIGVVTRNTSNWVVEFVATWLLGATVVPIDFRTPTAELAKLVSEFDIGMLLTDKSYTLPLLKKLSATAHGMMQLQSVHQMSHIPQVTQALPSYR